MFCRCFGFGLPEALCNKGVLESLLQQDGDLQLGCTDHNWQRICISKHFFKKNINPILLTCTKQQLDRPSLKEDPPLKTGKRSLKGTFPARPLIQLDYICIWMNDVRFFYSCDPLGSLTNQSVQAQLAICSKILSSLALRMLLSLAQFPSTNTWPEWEKAQRGLLIHWFLKLLCFVLFCFNQRTLPLN